MQGRGEMPRHELEPVRIGAKCPGLRPLDVGTTAARGRAPRLRRRSRVRSRTSASVAERARSCSLARPVPRAPEQRRFLCEDVGQAA